MKRLKPLWIIVGAVLSVFLLFTGIPVKIAVTEASLKNKTGYILIERMTTTGFSWVIVGDENGFYYEGDGRFVQLTGKEPAEGCGLSIEWGRNVYVCYGEVTGEGYFDSDFYQIYDVKKWDILYPVDRNNSSDFFQFSPKWCLSSYDYIFSG